MQTTFTSPARSFNVARGLGILLLFCALTIIPTMTLDKGIPSATSPGSNYDSHVKASITSIPTNESNPLVKGSILDYKGYLINYSFIVDGKTFSQTEVIRSSEVDHVASVQDLISNSGQSIWIQYNSKNPTVASIDFSKSMAAS